jgi:4-hydroxybenzoate polyprenyltransferase
VYLELGRVSNLPTVWSNVLAGAALAGAGMSAGLVWVALAASAFYVGGMFLNDAFDRGWDATHRPERPIPSGRIDASEVFLVGAGLLAAGQLVLATQGGAATPGLILAGLIVAYDAWHKVNPASPVVMALCRVMVYVIAARALGGGVTWPVIAGATVLFAYLVGLTWWAKKDGEHVAELIAGISAVDGLLALCAGRLLFALVAVAAIPLTLRWQRRVAGT